MPKAKVFVLSVLAVLASIPIHELIHVADLTFRNDGGEIYEVCLLGWDGEEGRSGWVTYMAGMKASRIGVFWSDNFYTELLALLEEKRMKVSAYMRESSADTTKAPSIHEQGGAFALWVQENKYEEIKRYEDNGFSGGDWKRPSWNKLVK